MKSKLKTFLYHPGVSWNSNFIINSNVQDCGTVLTIVSITKPLRPQIFHCQTGDRNLDSLSSSIEYHFITNTISSRFLLAFPCKGNNNHWTGKMFEYGCCKTKAIVCVILECITHALGGTGKKKKYFQMTLEGRIYEVNGTVCTWPWISHCHILLWKTKPRKGNNIWLYVPQTTALRNPR